MAARRGKTQARRNHGNNGGLPGWAWMVLGIVLTIAVVLLAPRWLKSDGDGIWRPQPNPDAQPARADGGDEAIAVDDGVDPAAAAAPDGDAEEPEFDFYTLLPGKETALSDAELAATQRAEAQRAEQAQAAAQPEAAALPRPVDTETAALPAKPPAAPAAAAATTSSAGTDNARYLLQAGAFQASGQAEELKARIALLGLGARVESAQIAGKTIYRVRMGPYGTAGELAEAKAKLARGGLPGMAIKVQ